MFLPKGKPIKDYVNLLLFSYLYLMKELKEIVDSIIKISAHSLAAIAELVVYRNEKKGALFLVKGKPDHCEYFLIKGICRSFLVNPEGEEITISFFREGSVLSPYVTRNNKGITNINFQALTDITLGEMDAGMFEELMISNMEVRIFGNRVLLKELQQKVEKEINLASLSAKERLHIFRKEYPGFENLVPHPAIATFLGITNVSLSRLRAAKA